MQQTTSAHETPKQQKVCLHKKENVDIKFN